MSVKVKRGGAYADAAAILVKRGGAYVAATELFVKKGGAYTSAMPSSTITVFPYTLQLSDKGKALTLTPTAEAVINVPAGLGADFTVTLQAGNDVPVKLVETGAALRNADGKRIGANTAKNMMLRSGAVATISPAATPLADSLVLTGQIGFWQGFGSRGGYNDSWNAGANIRQAFGTAYYSVTGTPGEFVRSIKVAFTNVWGPNETVIAHDLFFACAVEYPIGGAGVPFLFNGQKVGTILGGTKAVMESDALVLPTQMLIKDVMDFCRLRTWGQAPAGGSVPNGKGLAIGYEVFRAGTVAGTSENYTEVPATSLPNTGLLAAGGTGSPGSLRPFYVIAVTNVGTRILLLNSRAQPSNGDYPTMGYNFASGDAESVWSSHGPTLNLCCASASTVNLYNPSFGSIRMSAFKYGTSIGYADPVNDLSINGGQTVAQMLVGLRGRLAALKARPEAANMPLAGVSAPPWTLSTDNWTTLANQTRNSSGDASGYQYSELLTAYNVAGAAGQIPEFNGGFIDARSVDEVMDGGVAKWPVAPGGRTITAAGSMAVGSNTVTLLDNTAPNCFDPTDTGYYLTIGTITGQMTYISPTQVSLTGVVSGLNVTNTGAALTNVDTYVRSKEHVGDGLHATRRHMLLKRAARL